MQPGSALKIAVVAIGLLALGPARPAVAGNDPTVMLDVSRQVPRIERMMRELTQAVADDPILMAGLRQASQDNDRLSDAAIAARDDAWRLQAKRGRGALLDAVLTNPMARQLALLRLPRAALISDLMMMDDRGALVAATRLSSDYDQSDEPKFNRTFSQGAGGLTIEEAAYDESSDDYVVAASATLADPVSGLPLGVLTANISLANLQR